jgi:hypothetical protein
MGQAIPITAPESPEDRRLTRVLPASVYWHSLCNPDLGESEGAVVLDGSRSKINGNAEGAILMKSKLMLSLIVVLGLALTAAIAGEAEKHVWVSADGGHHSVHGNVMFIAEDGEAFDLSDLADGETRIFGTGEKQVTATRDGDVATITREPSGDESGLEITCHLSKDTCKIMTDDGDPEKVMIMIKKTRECIDGEGDCDEGLELMDLGFTSDDAHTIVIRKTVECDDEGNCTEDVTHHGGPHGDAEAIIELHAGVDAAGEVIVVGEGGSWVGDHAEGNVVFITRDDKVSLRCPEGDTTMRVEKNEADDVFLCPKHSVPLEKVPSKGAVREIKVRTKEKPHEH